MAIGSSSVSPSCLAELLHSGTLTGLADGELLARFTDRRDSGDAAAEAETASVRAGGNRAVT